VPAAVAKLTQFVNAQDALSRLDERVGRHPDKKGWCEQRILQDACDAYWVSGKLVDPHDLTLHKTGSAQSLSDPALLSAQQRTRQHHQFLQKVSTRSLQPEEILRIFGRRAHAPENDLTLYDPDEDRFTPLITFCETWAASADQAPLPRVLAAFKSWISLAVFAHALPADGFLLAERLAMSSRLTRQTPLAIATGARAIKWRPSLYRLDEDFEDQFLSAAEASARSGMLALDAHDLWRERAGGFLKTKRMSSHASDILDLVAQNGVVSARSIEETTGLTIQTAARQCNAMVSAGILREITGQKHFRIWSRG
jgi:hypothetical protein